MWLSLLKYNYKDYFLDDDHTSMMTSTLNKQREQFIQNLIVKSETNFPVELVKEEGTPAWFNEHHVR